MYRSSQSWTSSWVMVGCSSSAVIVRQRIARIGAEGHGHNVQHQHGAEEAEQGHQLVPGFRPLAVARMDRDGLQALTHTGQILSYSVLVRATNWRGLTARRAG